MQYTGNFCAIFRQRKRTDSILRPSSCRFYLWKEHPEWDIDIITHHKCLNNCSWDLYTIFFICLTDISNSSLHGSKQIPSNSDLLRIAQLRSACLWQMTYWSIAYSSSLREYCDRSLFMFLQLLFVFSKCLAPYSCFSFAVPFSLLPPSPLFITPDAPM